MTEDGKAIQAEIDESKSLYTIKDLIDALSIITSSNQLFKLTSTPDLVEVMNMQVENPAIITSAPEELSFLGDSHGKWCLQIARQRVLKKNTIGNIGYPEFLKD